MAKQLYIVSFTVKGSGDFPIDMLRYDSCSPSEESGASAIGWNSTTGYEPGGTRVIRVETRGRLTDWEPTYVRWKRFGWEVLPGSFQYHPHYE